MADPVDGSITHVFGQMRRGNPNAAGKLLNQFFPRLVGLARKTLDGNPRQVADEQDAAQSAFASFWQRAERGDFGGDLDRNEIWKLLSTITVRKALKQIEREKTQKRGGGRVHAESSLAAMAHAQGGTFGLDQQFGAVPSEEFDLICEELLMQLDDEPRAFALMRLMGYKNREIAKIHDCTERKVERKLQLIRLIWQNEPTD
jgi:DNA-directed RNA polymerase specialized sigma24 family protein